VDGEHPPFGRDKSQRVGSPVMIAPDPFSRVRSRPQWCAFPSAMMWCVRVGDTTISRFRSRGPARKRT